MKRDRKDYHKQYYLANRERLLAHKKEYYDENQEVILGKRRRYYEDNRKVILEKLKIYNQTENGKETQYRYEQSLKGRARRKRAIKKYYYSKKGKLAWAVAKENRAFILHAYMRAWRQTPIGRALIKAHKANRRNAGYISNSLVRRIEQANIKKYGILTCEYCKIPVGDKYHLEHKTPISRGGRSKRVNLCIACPQCNLSKGTLTADEFRKRLKVI